MSCSIAALKSCSSTSGARVAGARATNSFLPSLTPSAKSIRPSTPRAHAIWSGAGTYPNNVTAYLRRLRRHMKASHPGVELAVGIPGIAPIDETPLLDRAADWQAMGRRRPDRHAGHQLCLLGSERPATEHSGGLSRGPGFCRRTLPHTLPDPAIQLLHLRSTRIPEGHRQKQRRAGRRPHAAGLGNGCRRRQSGMRRLQQLSSEDARRPA